MEKELSSAFSVSASGQLVEKREGAGFDLIGGFKTEEMDEEAILRVLRELLGKL